MNEVDLDLIEQYEWPCHIVISELVKQRDTYWLLILGRIAKQQNMIFYYASASHRELSIDINAKVMNWPEWYEGISANCIRHNKILIADCQMNTRTAWFWQRSATLGLRSWWNIVNPLKKTVLQLSGSICQQKPYIRVSSAYESGCRPWFLIGHNRSAVYKRNRVDPWPTIEAFVLAMSRLWHHVSHWITSVRPSRLEVHCETSQWDNTDNEAA